MIPTMVFPSAVVIVFYLITQGHATCYDTSGNEKDTFLPCNPSADVSVCCSTSDYCLDNGLCLDAAGDNIFTVQGCTSRTWEAPCKQYCPDLPPTTDWYQDLTLCKTNDRESGEYCCGQDASCCNDTASYITIPLFASVYRGTDATSVSTTTSATPSSLSPGAPSQKTNDDSRTLGLGLGLGLSLGLLAPAVAFLGWELRKRNTILRMKDSGETSQYYQARLYEHEGTPRPPPPLPPQELSPAYVERELPGDHMFSQRL
ncbi:hypothetical protein F5Y03DRAFT_8023 [Xylaria venustula]|nr:hypothetical protein F5Y03DRAFT_8023 [Xylaria venustula]